jgi:hypothetical protein
MQHSEDDEEEADDWPDAGACVMVGEPEAHWIQMA